MSPGTIVLTGKLTAEDIADMDRYYYRAVFSWPYRILMGTVSVFVAGLVLFGNLGISSVPVSVCILTLCAHFPFGWLLLRRCKTRRHYYRRALRSQECTITFTSATISIAFVETELRLPWKQFAPLLLTPRGLLFLLQPRESLFWLPNRLFEGNTLKAEVLTLALENNLAIREVR